MHRRGTQEHDLTDASVFFPVDNPIILAPQELAQDLFHGGFLDRDRKIPVRNPVIRYVKADLRPKYPSAPLATLRLASLQKYAAGYRSRVNHFWALRLNPNEARPSIEKLKLSPLFFCPSLTPIRTNLSDLVKRMRRRDSALAQADMKIRVRDQSKYK